MKKTLMPRYEYKCDACEKTSLVTHGIKEKLTVCPVCKKEGHLHRIPSFVGNYKIKKSTKNKTGSVVKSFIENAKEELKQQKQELSNKHYEDKK